MDLGYVWERFCFASYAPFLVYTLINKPGYFGHLTYWALVLHAVYFTIDKASPRARWPVYILFAMSFTGAIAIFFGYTFISIGGIYRFGSWTMWENAVGYKAGTVASLYAREFPEVAVQKAYEHLWPVFATLGDVYFNKKHLKVFYAGAPKLRTTICSVALFLIYATVWELQNKAGGHGSPLDVYVQPVGMAATPLLAQFGIENPGLPEDFFFTNGQKATLIGAAVAFWWSFVVPLFAVEKAKAKTK